jgi:hypothetical protein
MISQQVKKNLTVVECNFKNIAALVPFAKQLED